MKKVLIVIDMLNDFINEEGALYCGQTAKNIVPFICNRVEKYNNDGNPIIFLQDSHDKNDKEFERFPPHAITGTWGGLSISELCTELCTDIIVYKTRYSGFHDTILNPILKNLNPDEVEVVGVCTSICVMDTVGDLANRDYNVTVPRAGVADFDQDNHISALKRMKILYGAKVV